MNRGGMLCYSISCDRRSWSRGGEFPQIPMFIRSTVSGEKQEGMPRLKEGVGKKGSPYQIPEITGGRRLISSFSMLVLKSLKVVGGPCHPFPREVSRIETLVDADMEL